MSIWNLKLKKFLEKTASADPTPGGGSVSVVSASFGLGLVVMALEVSSKKDEQIKGLVSDAKNILDRLTVYADKDIKAFKKLMREMRSSKKEKQEAGLEAARVPLESAREMFEALKVADRALELVSKNIVSDVISGALILDSAIQAVLYNVDVNLPIIKDTPEAVSFNVERKTLSKASREIIKDISKRVEKII